MNFRVVQYPFKTVQKPELMDSEELLKRIGSGSVVAGVVDGDCLAGAGIDDGDYIAFSSEHFPRPPKYKSKDGFSREDICACQIARNGHSFPAVKAYGGVWGSTQAVHTRYKQQEGQPHRMDCGLFAERVDGVVFACWDSVGRLKWELPLGDFPNVLNWEPTIRGGNCSGPILVS